MGVIKMMSERTTVHSMQSLSTAKRCRTNMRLLPFDREHDVIYERRVFCHRTV